MLHGQAFFKMFLFLQKKDIYLSLRNYHGFLPCLLINNHLLRLPRDNYTPVRICTGFFYVFSVSIITIAFEFINYFVGTCTLCIKNHRYNFEIVKIFKKYQIFIVSQLFLHSQTTRQLLDHKKIIIYAEENECHERKNNKFVAPIGSLDQN
jgi:hypothetical protein